MSEVKLNNVCKIYSGDKGEEVTAVRDFNLDIADREFVVFVGPSGCGKSTTLRMIAGLEEISQGEVSINGRVVNDVAPKDRDIAMVFQNYALYPHMTVFDNMAFGLKLQKLPRAEIEQRVGEAAAVLGIEALLDRKPKALSGGQRQRVAVGRAIVRKPKVFLFDEPLSNLDAKMRVQMRTEITKLHQKLQATMIYVTHDQVEAMTMGTRIVVMKDGIIQQADAPLRVYHHPANVFVAGFLGSPPMNFFHGKLKSEGSALVFQERGGPLNLPLGPTRLTGPMDAEDVVLGIRPEHCELVTDPAANVRATFEAEIELVEPMGAETYFYARTGQHPVIIRSKVEADHTEIGRRRVFMVDVAKVHLFSEATGKRLN